MANCKKIVRIQRVADYNNVVTNYHNKLHLDFVVEIQFLSSHGNARLNSIYSMKFNLEMYNIILHLIKFIYTNNIVSLSLYFFPFIIAFFDHGVLNSVKGFMREKAARQALQ